MDDHARLNKEALRLPVYTLEIPSKSQRSRRPTLRLLSLTLLLLLLVSTLLFRHHIDSYLMRRDQTSPARNPAYLIRAKYGAVASENKMCSDIGVATLKAGGNAVDAAVSTTLCIGVANMFSYVPPMFYTRLLNTLLSTAPESEEEGS